ncbi:MAG TPA: hypothetical protein VFZ58_01080 [Candidatus Saccharimonadales bacterium]
MDELSSAQIAKLQYRIARLTEERDKETARADKAETDLVTAEALLDEAGDNGTKQLSAETAALERQLQELREAVADEADCLARAKQITEGIQTATNEARTALQAVLDATKEAERQLRAATGSELQKANGELAAVQERLRKLQAEADACEKDLASYGPIKTVSCGCQFLLKKGPDCKPGAMLTIVASCRGGLSDEDFTSHVVELT